MKKVYDVTCPECGTKLSEEMIEANLCWECGKILDESLLENVSESDTVEKEEEAPDILSDHHDSVASYKNVQVTSNETPGKDVKEKKEINKGYRLNYEKTLSTEEKKEWIEKYIGIKKFIAGVYAVIGLLIGYFVARICGFDAGGYVFCCLIGGVIASAVGVNAVGAAMMDAITAEQNIITEELLTELLNNSKKE